MRECQDSDVVRSEFNFSTLGIELGTWEKKKIQGTVMKLLQKVQVGGMWVWWEGKAIKMRKWQMDPFQGKFLTVSGDLQDVRDRGRTGCGEEEWLTAKVLSWKTREIVMPLKQRSQTEVEITVTRRITMQGKSLHLTILRHTSNTFRSLNAKVPQFPPPTVQTVNHFLSSLTMPVTQANRWKKKWRTSRISWIL